MENETLFILIKGTIMTVLTENEFHTLSALASAIPEENLKVNALALLDNMCQVIEGVGDRPITWQPTFIKIIQGTTDTSNLIQGGAPLQGGSIVVGNETVANGFKVIPLVLYQSRSLWDKDPESSRRLCNSPDSKVGWKYGDCNKCDFGFGGEGRAPDCNKEYSFSLMAEDFSNIYTLKFHKMSYRNGMDWQKEITASRTHPFKRIFELNGQTSEKKKTVKEIRAKLVGNTAAAYSPEAMAFLEAIYKKHVGDRQQFLVDYHTKIEQNLISRHNGDTGRGIGHDPETLEVPPEHVPAAEGAGSSEYKF